MQACHHQRVDGYVSWRTVSVLDRSHPHRLNNSARYAYIDFVTDRTTHGRRLEGVDVFISYDAVCALQAKIRKRFETHFPDSKDIINCAHFSIDALHINDHLDKCMYLYSANYQECTGHFHGVGTEQYWSENNQMGPQTRQMNPGHRQDKIIGHHSDWNWKKTGKLGKNPTESTLNVLINIKLAPTMAKDLRTAWSLYVENREYFRKITKLQKVHIPSWFYMNKEPVMEDGEVKSVYRHRSAKGKLASISDSMC